jgi:hypothetical protein
MNFSTNTVDFFINLNSSITSEIGFVRYEIMCNNTDEGGFFSSAFEVNDRTSVVSSTTAADTSSSIALTLFILASALLAFTIPAMIPQMIKNEIANMILRRSLFAIGLYLMMLNSAIQATIANAAGLPLTGEMFRYMFLYGIAGYMAIFTIVIKTLLDTLKLWRKNSMSRRGLSDEEDD